MKNSKITPIKEEDDEEEEVQEEEKEDKIQNLTSIVDIKKEDEMMPDFL